MPRSSAEAISLKSSGPKTLSTPVAIPEGNILRQLQVNEGYCNQKLLVRRTSSSSHQIRLKLHRSEKGSSSEYMLPCGRKLPTGSFQAKSRSIVMMGVTTTVSSTYQ
jgi:hypothetical protein